MSKKLTLDILQEIWTTIPGSVIAGGAIRDFFFDIAPKDIDVFTNQMMFQLPPSFVEKETPTQEGYDGGQISSIKNYDYKGYEVQIMILHGCPFSHMQEFDIDLCKASYAGNLVYTEDFIRDARNKTLTMRFKDGKEEKTRERAERINKKYGFQIKAA